MPVSAPMRVIAAITLAAAVALVPITAAAHSKTLTGYGATIAAWNSAHKMVRRHGAQSFVKDACYNCTAHTAGNHGANGAGCLYGALSVYGGVVDGYEMYLPNRTPLTTAETVVLRQFPSDRKILWTLGQPHCTTILVTSGKLKTALSSPKIGDSAGLVTVEFQTPASASQAASGTDVPFTSANAAWVTLDIVLTVPGEPYTVASAEEYVTANPC